MSKFATMRQFARCIIRVNVKFLVGNQNGSIKMDIHFGWQYFRFGFQSRLWFRFEVFAHDGHQGSEEYGC